MSGKTRKGSSIRFGRRFGRRKNHTDKGGVESTPAMNQMYYSISPTKNNPRASKAHNDNITPPTTPQTAPSTPMAFSVTSSNGTGTTTPTWQETDAEKKHRCMSRLHNLSRGHRKSLTQTSLLDEEDEHIPVPVQSTSGHIISNAVFRVVNPCMSMDLAKDSVKGIMTSSISFFYCNGQEAGFACGRGGLRKNSKEVVVGLTRGGGGGRSRGSYHEENEESLGCSEDSGTLASLSTDMRSNNDLSVDTTDTESEEESLANNMNRLSMESEYAAAAAAAPPRVKRVTSVASRPTYDSADLGITSFRIMPNARSNSMSPERGSSAEVISTNMVIDMIALNLTSTLQ